VLTGRGWSGRCGGRAAGCGEHVQPFVFAVAALREVQGDVAVPGGAGGDGDLSRRMVAARALAKGRLARARLA
jgi:hypothetical protein